MRQPTRGHHGVLILLLLHAIAAVAASLKTTYTLAYAPVGASASKPTPFAVLVSSPRELTHEDIRAEQPAKQSSQSDTKAAGNRQDSQQRRWPLAAFHRGPILELESYTPPAKKEGAARAQIGILDASGKAFNGSSTLASVAALKDPLAATLIVQLGMEWEAQSVSLREFTRGGGEKKAGSKSKVVGPAVEVVRAAAEPKPVLNRPVVLNAEGKVDEEVKEKTLLQRYWWVGLIVLAFTLMGGEGK